MKTAQFILIFYSVIILIFIWIITSSGYFDNTVNEKFNFEILTNCDTSGNFDICTISNSGVYRLTFILVLIKVKSKIFWSRLTYKPIFKNSC